MAVELGKLLDYLGDPESTLSPEDIYEAKYCGLSFGIVKLGKIDEATWENLPFAAFGIAMDRIAGLVAGCRHALVLFGEEHRDGIRVLSNCRSWEDHKEVILGDEWPLWSVLQSYAVAFHQFALTLAAARHYGPIDWERLHLYSEDLFKFAEIWQDAVYQDLFSAADTHKMYEERWKPAHTVINWLGAEQLALSFEASRRNKKPEGVTVRELLGMGKMGRPKRLKWLTEAMMLVSERPRYPDAQIAKMVGVNKSTLSRNPTYQRAAQLARSGTPPPWGTKNGKTGDVELDPTGNRGRRRGRTRAYDDDEE